MIILYYNLLNYIFKILFLYIKINYKLMKYYGVDDFEYLYYKRKYMFVFVLKSLCFEIKCVSYGLIN